MKTPTTEFALQPTTQVRSPGRSPPSPGVFELPLWIWLFVPIVAAIIGSMITVWLALAHDDPVIGKNWSRLGKAVVEESHALEAAARLTLAADVEIDRPTGRVQLQLRGQTRPAIVQLHFIHPTRTELDRATVLTRGPDGIYRGQLALPDVERGAWLLHDSQHNWALESAQAQLQNRFTLAPPQAVAIQ